MANLNPAPATLGLTSPVLGPWFQKKAESDTDLSPLNTPKGNLACVRDFPDGAIWNAPAAGILSYFIATATRPDGLADLRKADGEMAFDDGALILLFTLLPEVSNRLSSLSQAVPRPDSTTTATEGEITRPEINRLAIEIPISFISKISDLASILPDKYPSDLKGTMEELVSNEDKAAFLGLTFDGIGGNNDGNFGNADTPATILRRPEKDSARLIENSLRPFNANLWAFDIHGHPYDPGTVAAIWGHLANDDWENLWASSNPDRQRTAGVIKTKTVHLVNGHEGPLEQRVKDRVSSNLTNLDSIDSSEVLFKVREDENPAIGLSASTDEDTDTVPLARIAPLPAGPYTTFSDATPFSGWQDASALSRDFLRVAITDIERLTVGLGRDADTPQADTRLRVSPQRNTADPVFLANIDDVATKVMERFNDTDAAVSFIAPELDRLWGPQSSPILGNVDVFLEEFDNPTFNTYTLTGSGSTSGQTAENQSIVLQFEAILPDSKSGLPNAAWIRVWPHGRDTETGRRFRMDGGAALSDNAGAIVVLPLPNGTNGDGTDTVQFSFDMLVSTASGHRLYVDLLANRPAVTTGSGAIAITDLTATQNLFCPERSANFTVATGDIEPGLSLLVIEGDINNHQFTMFDTDTLRAEDMSASLINRANANDKIVTFNPAFKQTEAGDLNTAQGTSEPERIHEGGFYTKSTGQEILDFAAYNANNNRGVIAALSARVLWHEAPPASLGHIGKNASPEIHGEGVAIEGPVADSLRLLMRERTPQGIVEFIQQMGTPFNAEAEQNDPGVWTAILETSAKGTHGDILIGLIPASVEPGLDWDNTDTNNLGIKQRIDSALSSLPGNLTVDSIIDSNDFDDNLAAANFDRILLKSRKGTQGFARAAIASIEHAEDLIWLQSPVLDDETWAGDEDIYLLGSIAARLDTNKALHCVIVIPEKHHPGQNTKLAKIRESAIGNAMHKLLNIAQDRIVFCTPLAFHGRSFHMTSTSLIVDDVVMFSGAAHTWRRGLTFDAAFTAAIFDERLSSGKPQTVIQARLEMAGNMLGVGAEFVPKTAKELILAIKAQNNGGGFGRTNSNTFVKSSTKNATENAIWNPAVSNDTDWTAFLSTLIGDTKTEFEDGVR